jgi:hypothetical protein
MTRFLQALIYHLNQPVCTKFGAIHQATRCTDAVASCRCITSHAQLSPALHGSLQHGKWINPGIKLDLS